MQRFGNSFWTVRMISLVVLAFFSSVGLVRYTAELALRNGAFPERPLSAHRF
jgi:hypothetical protein